jgi:hypothetical protein
MAVDLSNYVDSLKRECSPPGVDDFSAATDSDWIGNLSDAFWEARLDGLLVGYTCDENGLVTQVTPSSPPVDLGRDMVQLVVLYASFRILRNALRGFQTQFAATAGPVKFEYAQSATLLVALMKDITDRRNIILARLSDLGTCPAFVIDAVMARDESLRLGIIDWVGYGENNVAIDYGYGQVW